MTINAAELLQGTAGSVRLELAELPEPFIYLDEELRFHQPVLLSGTLTKLGVDRYVLTGRLQAVLELECGYCLDAYSFPIEAEIDALFARGQKAIDNEEDFYPVESEEISLDELIRTNVILNLPALRRCKEDCKGLCPVCGANLNRETCSCGDNEEKDTDGAIDARFAVLKDFFEK